MTYGIGIRMLNLSLIIIWLLNQTVVQGHYNRKQLSYEISMVEAEAKMFLRHGSRVKRSTTPAFCNDMSKESTCELRSSECHTEEFREHLCRKGINACLSYLMCAIDASSNWCPAHYTTQCTNVCDTLVPRCKNGGTCMNISTDDYRCICPQGFDGKDCDSERCKMGPADVVFLVDSSVSQGKDNFSKQLDFIKEFVKSIYIGQTFFRVSVITFSFNARVEFNLTKYLDNYTLLDAIDRIHYNPGITNTGRALRAAREEVFPSNRTDVTKRVIILTDSMFSNKSDTIIQAKLLKDAGVTIVTIGVGSGVLHEELLEIASDYSDFFNVSTFDGLSSIQHKIGRCVYEDTLSPDFCRSNLKSLDLYTLERRMIEWNGIKFDSSSPEDCRVTFYHHNHSYQHENRICFYIANFMGQLGTYLQLVVFSGWSPKDDKYKEKIFTNNFTFPSEYCYDHVPAGFILYTPEDQRGTGYLRIYVTIETIKKIPEGVYTNYIPYILGGVGAFVLIVVFVANKCDPGKTCEFVFMAILYLIISPFVIIYLCIYVCCIYCPKKCSRVLTESRDAAACAGCCRFRSQNQEQATPKIEISALSVISNQVSTSSYAVADAETGTSSSDEQSDLPFNSSRGTVVSVELSGDEVRDDKTNCSCLFVRLFHRLTRTDNN